MCAEIQLAHASALPCTVQPQCSGTGAAVCSPRQSTFLPDVAAPPVILHGIQAQTPLGFNFSAGSGGKPLEVHLAALPRVPSLKARVKFKLLHEGRLEV